jgi:hypothetical protein
MTHLPALLPLHAPMVHRHHGCPQPVCGRCETAALALTGRCEVRARPNCRAAPRGITGSASASIATVVTSQPYTAVLAPVSSAVAAAAVQFGERIEINQCVCVSQGILPMSSHTSCIRSGSRTSANGGPRIPPDRCRALYPTLTHTRFDHRKSAELNWGLHSDH